MNTLLVWLLVLVIEGQAWRKPSLAIITAGSCRGGASNASEPSDDFQQQKKRKINPKQENISEEDEYEYEELKPEEEEWFEETEELTEEEIVVERPDESMDHDGATQYDASIANEPVGYEGDNETAYTAEKKEPSDSFDTALDTTATLLHSSTSSPLPADEASHEDDGSSTDIDRMELADAYDDDVATLTADAPVESVTPSSFSTIEAETERILKDDLKYSSHEIKLMKPAVAAVVAAKRLHRPVEGMPRNWYQDANSAPARSRSKRLAKWGKIVPRIIAPVAVGAFAFAQREPIIEVLSNVFPRRPDSPLNNNNHYDLENLYTDSLLFQVEDNGPREIVPSHDHKPHSIKPGSLPDDELDITWLDKLITAIERRVKAFLRWEI